LQVRGLFQADAAPGPTPDGRLLAQRFRAVHPLSQNPL